MVWSYVLEQPLDTVYKEGIIVERISKTGLPIGSPAAKIDRMWGSISTRRELFKSHSEVNPEDRTTVIIDMFV